MGRRSRHNQTHAPSGSRILARLSGFASALKGDQGRMRTHRNAPCRRGSGLNYKQCLGSPVLSTVPARPATPTCSSLRARPPPHPPAMPGSRKHQRPPRSGGRGGATDGRRQADRHRQRDLVFPRRTPVGPRPLCAGQPRWSIRRRAHGRVKRRGHAGPNAKARRASTAC